MRTPDSSCHLKFDRCASKAAAGTMPEGLNETFEDAVAETNSEQLVQKSKQQRTAEEPEVKRRRLCADCADIGTGLRSP